MYEYQQQWRETPYIDQAYPRASTVYQVEPLPRPPFMNPNLNMSINPNTNTNNILQSSPGSQRVYPYDQSDAETIYEHGIDRSDVQTLWQHDGLSRQVSAQSGNGNGSKGREYLAGLSVGMSGLGLHHGLETGTRRELQRQKEMNKERERDKDKPLPPLPDSHRPAFPYHRPAFPNNQSPFQNHQPPSPHRQPPFRYHQPPPSHHQPPFSHQQPTFPNQQPAASSPQAKLANLQPTVPNPQPIGDWRLKWDRPPPMTDLSPLRRPRTEGDLATTNSQKKQTTSSPHIRQTVTPKHKAASSSDLLSPPRPQSDRVTASSRKSIPRRGSNHPEAIYVPSSPSSSSSTSTLSSSTSSTSSSSSNLPKTVTTRSPARIRRATSEQPRTVLSTSTPTGIGKSTRCAGFTRQGQPCKRLVRAEAPYLTSAGQGDGDRPEEGERGLGRYCRDHAGMICQAEGFYARASKGAGAWIEFDKFIPPELGQQTQTLLRMVMESKLTNKEVPGFLYAYELRDLQTPDTSYFKIGRTDNPPRRVSEWTTNCPAHKITLRDVFPLSRPPPPTSPLIRKPSAPTSYLPGAHSHNLQSAQSKMCPAMKRWERLVHLEMAERSATTRPKEFNRVREKCKSCEKVHREIFPVARLSNDGKEYLNGVVEIISRWEMFVTTIVSIQND
ncbi:hypothetical protein BCR39DRAFT_586319 [Naematelia encephala]|uniref:Bacteriophage T5 Orf172 DNA-binding domain-containing protein n=1 Tax=Naematelia encephala TaxID=71784 RepID=A0A1Y2BGT0_9TREE|nr:hypothetical protein BCR39DRAFT_586319 [Naematelia encephala]